ncbi:MAG: porin family protein [Cytophagales bacterium]|nr:porin family protein [Cytophagales bacterium]
MYRIILIITLIFSFAFLSAQDTRWGIGLHGGGMFYAGDFAAKTQIGYGFGLAVNKKLSPVFAIQGHLLNETLKATTDSSTLEAKVFDYTLNFHLNFTKDRIVTPYFFLGVGFTNFESIRKDSSGNIVAAYGYKKYGNAHKDEATIPSPFKFRQTEMVVPLGLGINFSISDHIDLGLEFCVRNINTDKLDIIDENGKIIKDHGPADDPNVVGSGWGENTPLGKMDRYGYASFNLTINFGPKPGKKPKPVEPIITEPGPVVASTSNFPAEYISADTDSDENISADEIYAVIDAFFEGETDFTVDTIYELIDYFFEQ